MRFLALGLAAAATAWGFWACAPKGPGESAATPSAAETACECEEPCPECERKTAGAETAAGVGETAGGEVNEKGGPR